MASPNEVLRPNFCCRSQIFPWKNGFSLIIQVSSIKSIVASIRNYITDKGFSSSTFKIGWAFTKISKRMLLALFELEFKKYVSRKEKHLVRLQLWCWIRKGCDKQFLGFTCRRAFVKIYVDVTLNFVSTYVKICYFVFFLAWFFSTCTYLLFSLKIK